MTEIEQLQMKLLETRVKKLELQCEKLIEQGQYLIRRINEANLDHIINYSATANVLQDKGIITLEEYKESKVKITATADQEWAKKNDNLSDGS